MMSGCFCLVLAGMLIKLFIGHLVLRMYHWWSLCTLYSNACQVRVTVGDLGFCCCACVTSFERQLTPLCVDSYSQVILLSSLFACRVTACCLKKLPALKTCACCLYCPIKITSSFFPVLFVGSDLFELLI